MLQRNLLYTAVTRGKKLVILVGTKKALGMAGEGRIERVTYHNPENGFAVLKVQVKGRPDLVTVVGNTTSVTAGEHLEATGRWVVDRNRRYSVPEDG